MCEQKRYIRYGFCAGAKGIRSTVSMAERASHFFVHLFAVIADGGQGDK